MSIYEVKGSKVHGYGVFCGEKKITKGTRIMQYLGEKISRKEGDLRADKQLKKSKKGNTGAVFLFDLNSRYYLDGNIPDNPAKYVNHSCKANCYFEVERGKVYIVSSRSIKPGQELTLDYGFDAEVFEDHPCLCGEDNCIGYIVERRQWPKLRRLLREKAELEMA